MHKHELGKIYKKLENGEELRVDDAKMVRYISQMMTPNQREKTFIGRDKKNRTTLIKRF